MDNLIVMGLAASGAGSAISAAITVINYLSSPSTPPFGAAAATAGFAILFGVLFARHREAMVQSSQLSQPPWGNSATAAPAQEPQAPASNGGDPVSQSGGRPYAVSISLDVNDQAGDIERALERAKELEDWSKEPLSSPSASSGSGDPHKWGFFSRHPFIQDSYEVGSEEWLGIWQEYDRVNNGGMKVYLPEEGACQ